MWIIVDKGYLEMKDMANIAKLANIIDILEIEEDWGERFYSRYRRIQCPVCS